MARVGIVMPFKNAEKTLAAALDCLDNQTFKELIIIGVNDHSIDMSREIMEQRKFKHHSKLLDVPEGQGKIVDALNHGIAYAELRGCDYIARMDADDLCDHDRIRKQVTFMQKDKFMGLSGTHAVVTKGQKILEHFHPRPAPGKEKMWLTKFDYFIHGSCMFTLDACRRSGGYNNDIDLIEDYDLWFRIANQYHIGILEEELYTLTRSATTSTHGEEMVIYQRARMLREHWADKWRIEIPGHDMPDYHTIPK